MEINSKPLLQPFIDGVSIDKYNENTIKSLMN